MPTGKACYQRGHSALYSGTFVLSILDIVLSMLSSFYPHFKSITQFDANGNFVLICPGQMFRYSVWLCFLNDEKQEVKR